MSRSAMPMLKALAAFPDGEVMWPDMAKYNEVGRAGRVEMLPLTPLVELCRSTRHFLISAARKAPRGCPAQLLAPLARPIEDRLAITVSIGWSDTELLPKIASDLDKPRSFWVLNRSEAAVFLAGQAGYDAEGRYAPRLPGDGSTEIGQPCDPPTLFDREPDRPRRIEHAMNQIRTRLGEGSVRVGRSLRAPARRHCGAA
jgi:DNA polymerase-4